MNSDDFGMHRAVNDAVVRSIEEGISGSCSLMAPCPGAEHAMRLLRDRPEIPFGIHLTLVCDTPRRRWGPPAAKEEVPSLLDAAGELFTPDRIPELLAQARLDEVEREFRAQIAAVTDAGLAPTHLDWHCLADGGRADVFDLTVALAQEYGLAVRAWLDPARQKVRARRGATGAGSRPARKLLTCCCPHLVLSSAVKSVADVTAVALPTIIRPG
ncbi:ChbG/HpnK family deacetylase [Nonomuraea angiospora]|uniref:ChbG/HpnK family deacetylase n=1 Tax=Nonomuraea angiospora TaxID=46172 RepID=UPI0033D9EE05